MGHRNVTTNMNNTFNQAYKLLQDVTSVYVLLTADHIGSVNIKSGVDSTQECTFDELEQLSSEATFHSMKKSNN